MRQDIYINSSSRKPRECNIRGFFLKVIILFPVILFVLLFVFEKGNFLSAVEYLFSKKDIVTYNTYSLNLDISQELANPMWESLNELDFNGKKRFEENAKKSDIVISLEESDGFEIFANADMIPVVHLYSLVSSINTDDLGSYEFFSLDTPYLEYLEEEYGINIEVVDEYDDLITILSQSDSNIGLLSLEDISFETKVLEVNDRYYLEDAEGSFSVEFFIKKDSKVEDYVVSVLKKNLGLTSQVLEEDSLVKINMGGVVALTRALGTKLDSLGDGQYPSKDLTDFLSDADLTHVSNEVSFVPGCTNVFGMRFCSKPEYMDVLTNTGVDIVELTGNHNNDYGSEYSRSTIEMYTDLGMRYFGGGLDEQDASSILYEEINGAKVAFVGYNYYDTMLGTLALAGDQRSGANSYSQANVEADMQEAKEKADLVIVTFQFQECYSYPATDVIYPICYKPLRSPDQRGVFKHAIDSGADIVVGTQAHQPQTYELYGDGVIYYGLGNLFFDQGIWIGTRQGIVLSHYLYEGEYIQTRLTPIYMDKNLIPRLATQEEGDLLLELLKDARD